MPRTLLATLPAAALAAGLVVAAGAGGAVAGSLVTSAQIKDGTIQSKDMAPAARSVQRYSVVTEADGRTAGDTTALSAYCPAGTKVLGGSAYWGTSAQAVQVLVSSGSVRAYPQAQGADDNLYVQAVCGQVGSYLPTFARQGPATAKH